MENNKAIFQFTKAEVAELIMLQLNTYSEEELIYFLRSLLKDNKQSNAVEEVELNPDHVGSNFDDFLN